MNKENLKRIHDLSFLSMEVINDMIDNAEKEASARIELVSEYIQAMNVSCNIRPAQTISEDVQKAIGLRLSATWNKDFPGNPTTREKRRSVFWYGVRDSIHDLCRIVSAKEGKKTISINSDMEYYITNGWNIKLVKSFANGRYDFEITEDLQELIAMVKTIQKNFECR